jgi:Rrf2 family protein
VILSRSADYGLRALIYLAQAAREVPVPLERIAEVQRVPAALLSKILQALVRAGVLRSHRGYGGGFVLLAEPTKLSLEAVIEAIDGPLVVFECLDDETFCELCQGCRLQEKLREVERAMRGILRSTTLADCLPLRTCEGVAPAIFREAKGAPTPLPTAT